MKKHIIRTNLTLNRFKNKQLWKAVFKIIINKITNQLIKLAIKTIKINKNLIYKTRTINILQMKLDKQINLKFHILQLDHMTNLKYNRVALFKMLRKVKITSIHLSLLNPKKIELASLIQMNIRTKIEMFRIQVNMQWISNFWVDPAKTIASSIVRQAQTINVQI